MTNLPSNNFHLINDTWERHLLTWDLTIRFSSSTCREGKRSEDEQEIREEVNAQIEKERKEKQVEEVEEERRLKCGPERELRNDDERGGMRMMANK